MKTVAIDTGERVGRLLVVDFAEPNPSGHRQFRCRCDCGAETVATASNLRSGKTRSCGCLRSDVGLKGTRTRLVRHGLCGTPTYRSWQGMIQRCTNPKVPKWKHYGGRGITVCERWRDFTNFLADMGERPDGRTLDRTDPDGNYEPGNCRWATAVEQRHNRGSGVRI